MSHSQIPKRFSADLKNRRKNIFWHSLVRNEIYFSKNSVFYFHCTFYFQFRGCSVSLSIMGIIQCKSDAFWCRPENRKTPLPLTFFGLKRSFLFDKIASFLFQRLVPPLRQHICEFERSWCHTVKFRMVVVRNRKPKKPIFWDFWPKTQFFCMKLPLSFLVHLTS